MSWDNIAQIPLKESKAFSFARFVKIPLLIEVEELEKLLNTIEPCYLFRIGRPLEPPELEWTKKQYIELYAGYLDALKKGLLLEKKLYRSILHFICANDPMQLAKSIVTDGKWIVYPRFPVIYWQYHEMYWDPHFLEMKSMTFNASSFSWGIQMMCPMLYESQRKEEKENRFSHSSIYPIFHQMRRWIRQHTSPAVFDVQGKKVNSSVRISQKCFSWINTYLSRIIDIRVK